MAKKAKEIKLPDINPCPFCGGKAPKVSINPWGLYVFCNGCGACGPNVMGEISEIRAISKWNNRK